MLGMRCVQGMRGMLGMRVMQVMLCMQDMQGAQSIIGGVAFLMRLSGLHGQGWLFEGHSGP